MSDHQTCPQQNGKLSPQTEQPIIPKMNNYSDDQKVFLSPKAFDLAFQVNKSTDITLILAS